MAKLEMDIDNCTLIHDRFNKVRGDFGATLEALVGKIAGGLDTAWRGRSAVEFTTEFSNVTRDLRNELKAFGSLAEKLDSAIATYKQADEKFG